MRRAAMPKKIAIEARAMVALPDDPMPVFGSCGVTVEGVGTVVGATVVEGAGGSCSTEELGAVVGAIEVVVGAAVVLVTVVLVAGAVEVVAGTVLVVEVVVLVVEVVVLVVEGGAVVVVVVLVVVGGSVVVVVVVVVVVGGVSQAAIVPDQFRSNRWSPSEETMTMLQGCCAVFERGKVFDHWPETTKWDATPSIVTSTVELLGYQSAVTLSEPHFAV